jgi:hypothetical protein
MTIPMRVIAACASRRPTSVAATTTTEVAKELNADALLDSLRLDL